jgi:hypothetical protein
MMFGHGDYTHHTSEDTSDKVDPVELERTGVIGAATMLYLANLNEQQAMDLTYLAGANAARRLGLSAQRAQRYLADATETNYLNRWANAQNVVDHEWMWCKETVQSVEYFNSGSRTGSVVEEVQSMLDSQHEILKHGLETTVAARGFGVGTKPVLDPNPDNRVPERLFRGPLGSGLPSQVREPTVARNARFETVNFMDGKRTVSEIWKAVSAEYGPIPKENVVNFIEDMVADDLARWK